MYAQMRTTAQCQRSSPTWECLCSERGTGRDVPPTSAYKVSAVG